jgi:hypothetical protein
MVCTEDCGARGQNRFLSMSIIEQLCILVGEMAKPINLGADLSVEGDLYAHAGTGY